MKYSYVLPILFLILLLASSVQHPALSVDNPASSIQYLKYQFEVARELTDHKRSTYSVTFSPNGKLMASGSEDSTVKLWNGDTGKRIKALMRHPFPILCVAFSPNSNVVAAGSAGGTITLWDVNYKERISTLKGHEGPVLSICFNPDGTLLASASADKIIRLWDMKTGKSIKWLVGHMDSVNSLAFSPDGKILVSGSADGAVRVWDVDSAKTIMKLEESSGAVNSICLSSDGKTLASGAASGIIRLWDMGSGQEKRTLTGHKGAIGVGAGLSFSPDDKILVSGSSDKSILVWDVSSGDVMHELKAHKAAVNSIAFNPDGKRMASASSDGIIKFWKILIKETLEITLDAEYDGWQRGILELKADILGLPDAVKFQYSLDGSTWMDIAEKNESPYTINWNTRTSIPGIAETVSLRAVAERTTGATAMDIAKGVFSIDNAPPETEYNYDGAWHREDFPVGLSASDGQGTGVAVIGYKLNHGQGKDTTWNDQPLITKEGMSTLEYWSVDKMGNEEPHKTLSDIKLDKTAPTFFNWATAPESLTEGATGPLRITVQVADKGGSGITGKTPQFDYHIGLGAAYDGYEDMSRADGDVWHYDIPEPPEGWDRYMGQAIYYRAICPDVAGNVGQSAERQELIGSSKAPPTVKMITRFRDWENGILTIEADASDMDGTVKNVQFEYSFDSISWTPIGSSDAPPYSVQWDTTADIPETEVSVWVRITATDSDDLTAKYVTPRLAVDNQPPVTEHDYDGKWRKKDFTVNLRANDAGGSGVSGTRYRLNGGGEKDVVANGQPTINRQGKNALEYWSIDVAGNEETHNTLSEVKLDRLSPLFGKWDEKQDGNVLRLQVEIVDADSGIESRPQLAYHIGQDTRYSDYVKMRKAEGDRWKYDIDIPNSATDTAGQTVFCKVSVKDSVGNLAIEPWEYKLTKEIKTTPGTAMEPEPTEAPEEPDSPPATRSEITKKKVAIVWNTQITGAVNVGEKADIQGVLKPEIGKSVPLSLTVMAPDDTVYVSQIDTNLDGAFQFSLPLTTHGEWRVSADWKGNDEYEAVRSQALTFRAVSEKSDASDGDKKTSRFLKKNTMIIGLVFLYIIVIRLYRN